MEAIRGASFAALFGLLICLVPVIVGGWFAIRPSERLLGVMRPLSLAAIFSACCSFALNLTNGFAMLGRMRTADPEYLMRTAAGMAEGFAPVAASFAVLTAAWLLVAIGTRRAP